MLQFKFLYKFYSVCTVRHSYFVSCYLNKNLSRISRFKYKFLETDFKIIYVLNFQENVTCICPIASQLDLHC